MPSDAAIPSCCRPQGAWQKPEEDIRSSSQVKVTVRKQRGPAIPHIRRHRSVPRPDPSSRRRTHGYIDGVPSDSGRSVMQNMTEADEFLVTKPSCRFRDRYGAGFISDPGAGPRPRHWHLNNQGPACHDMGRPTRRQLRSGANGHLCARERRSSDWWPGTGLPTRSTDSRTDSNGRTCPDHLPVELRVETPAAGTPSADLDSRTGSALREVTARSVRHRRYWP